MVSVSHITLKPNLDLIALLVPPSLTILILTYYTTTKLKLDLTPIAAAPLAYTLNHITITYIRELGDMLTLAHSIITGATITLLTISPITLATRKRWKIIA